MTRKINCIKRAGVEECNRMSGIERTAGWTDNSENQHAARARQRLRAGVYNEGTELECVGKDMM